MLIKKKSAKNTKKKRDGGGRSRRIGKERHTMRQRRRKTNKMTMTKIKHGDEEGGEIEGIGK